MTFLSSFLAAAEPAHEAAKGAASEAAGHGGPLDSITKLFGDFGVDGQHLLVQVVNFAILSFVLYRFAIKPALGQLEERIRLAEQLQKDRAEVEQKLAAATAAAEARLNAASDEAAKILADARNAAKAAVEAAKAEAVAAQADVVAKAKAAIESDRVKMLAEVRGEVSRLVVETAAKVLDQNLDDAQRGRLNEAAVKQLAR